MSLDRRHLLLSAAASGLAAAGPKPKGAGHPAPPGTGAADAALGRYFDQVSDRYLAASPETATSLGLDTGARAHLKSKLADASMAHIRADRAWCREGLAKLASFPDAQL